MKIYYAVGIVGLLDLRGVTGGFNTLKWAADCARKQAEKEKQSGGVMPLHNHKETSIGDWFSVHPYGGMVDGPYPTRERAETERKVICRKYAQDANYDNGFVAKAVKVFKTTAVVERIYKP